MRLYKVHRQIKTQPLTMLTSQCLFVLGGRQHTTITATLLRTNFSRLRAQSPLLLRKITDQVAGVSCVHTSVNNRTFLEPRILSRVDKQTFATMERSSNKRNIGVVSPFFSLQGFHSPLSAASPHFFTFNATENTRAASTTSDQTPSTDEVATNGDQPLESTDAYKQLSAKDKLKRLVAEYGASVMVVHMSNCLLMLGAFWLAVASGLDIPGILKSVGIESEYINGKLASGAGSFAVAYVAYKVLIPLRFAITFALTPVLVRYLRAKGFIKPPKAKPVAAADANGKVKAS